MCKSLDFLVFSDKDDKPKVLSHKPCSHITLWDVKEPTHYSKRVGDVVPGVVVYLCSSLIMAWEGSVGS